MYCVLNMGWTPSEFLELNRKDKAFVAACVDIKIEEEKQQKKKMKSKTPRVRRRR